MTLQIVVSGALVGVAILVTSAWYKKQRLDRLWKRVTGAATQLQASLDTRATALIAVAPRHEQLARQALDTPIDPACPGTRSGIEREIASIIAQEELCRHTRMRDASIRADIASRFYNGAVLEYKDFAHSFRLRSLLEVLPGTTFRAPEYFHLADHDMTVTDSLNAD